MNGLRNLGNTCYMNAALQMLLNNKKLSKTLIEINTEDKFIRKLAEFFRLYHSNVNRILVPKFIKNKISENFSALYGYGQQDSEEALTAILTLVNEKIPGEIIDDIFNISIKTTIKCKVLSCLTKKFYSEKSIKLIFEINNDTSSLDDCYRLFKISEKLDKDNMVFCEKCEKKTIVSRRAEVESWPDDLVIVLKRFDYSTGRGKKISKDIDVPLEWRKGYKLKGIIYHSGNINGGHYIYAGCNNNNNWYLFDDNSISIIKSNVLERLKNKGYIYHYSK